MGVGELDMKVAFPLLMCSLTLAGCATSTSTTFIAIQAPDEVREFGKLRFQVVPGDELEVLRSQPCRGGHGTCWAVRNVSTNETGFVSEDRVRALHRVYLAPKRPKTAMQLLEDARRHVEGGGAVNAIPLLEKADRIAKGSCLECLWVLAGAYNTTGEHGDAMKTARRLIAAAPPTDLLGRAHNQLGLGLMLGAGDDRQRLLQAEVEFRRAIELIGRDDNVILYNLARTLLRTGRQEEGLGALREIAASGPAPDLAAAVSLLLRDPTCADDACAPEFEITTIDGRRLSRESLKGKATLFCFCSTRFRPCVENLTELKRLARRMEHDPLAVVLVNYELAPVDLAAFAQQHDLGFPIYQDDGGRLMRSFRARAFPTEVIVDHEGRVVGRSHAMTLEQRRAVSRAIDAAVTAAREAQGEPAPARP
jgi:peroxiredoxin